MRYALFVTAVGFAALATSAGRSHSSFEGAAGGYVLLSNDYGGRTYIGLPIVGRNAPDEPVEAFPARPMSGEEIAGIFGRLCLTKPFDKDAYESARTASGFTATRRELPYFEAPKALIGVNKVAAIEITQDHSSNGIASLWFGEGVEGLKNRQFVRYSGSLVITGPVDPKDFYTPQCNLTLRISGLSSAKTLLDGIQSSATEFTVIKRIEKPKYAYAIWTSASSEGRVTRISAAADDLNKAEQTVHLTVQMLPAGKIK